MHKQNQKGILSYKAGALKNAKIDLRFYFITDDSAPGLSALRQVQIAVAEGATAVQYRNKHFSLQDLPEVLEIRDFCLLNRVCFVINDDILLARAVDADGVHLGQEDADAALARKILGNEAVIGISVSNTEELAGTDLSPCDYIGTGPVFATATKADAKAAIGTGGLADVVVRAPLPVVAIGGIIPDNVYECIKAGASGVAVISAVTRAGDPAAAAGRFAIACGLQPVKTAASWTDEFSLINRIILGFRAHSHKTGVMRIGAGDDAALLSTLKNPVFTTDTQHEGVHFRRRWQSMSEIGYKASEIALSDLAASYASPVALFVNLALPANISEDQVLQIYEGIQKSLVPRGAVPAGGNISSSRVLALDLFAAGEANPDIFPVRSAARPGWGLYATGPLGLARAGLDCLTRGDKEFAGLIRAFIHPVARFDAASVLAENRVECVMDISDGLAGDARHIAEASGVSINLDLSTVPVVPELAAYCEKYEKSPQKVMAAGGEDYELLFACPPGVFDAIIRQLPGAFQVGVCLPYTGGPVSGVPEGAWGYRHGERR